MRDAFTAAGAHEVSITPHLSLTSISVASSGFTRTSAGRNDSLQVWCIAPNDHFVMHAWGHEMGAHGKLRMMGDGSQRCAAALGLLWDLGEKGLGMRCHRALIIAKNGIIVHAVQEEPGKLEVSAAGAALQALSRL